VNGKIVDTLNGTFDAQGNQLTTPLNKAFRDEDETSIDRVFVTGGKNIFGNGSILDYRIGYTEGTYHKPYDVNSNFAYTPTAPTTITYGLTGPGHVPVYTIAGANYLDPNNYTLNGLSNSAADNFDKELSFAGDYQYPFQLVGSDESVKVGFDVRLRHKQTTAHQFSYPNLPSLPLTSVIHGGNEVYYNGIYQNGPDIVPGELQQILGNGVTQAADQLANDQQYLDVKENIYAGYGEYKVTLGQLGIIAGARVEATEDHANAFSITTDLSGNQSASPIATKHDYTNVFPGVQFKYEIEPTLLARFAYSSTIARPGFNQSNPSEAIDLGSGLITHGNPNLKPATSNNFDLSIEKYLGGSAIISLGFFDKEISNYIVGSSSGFRSVNVGGQTFNLQDVTFSNASKSYVRGIEFNVEERFRLLPGLLSGLGVSANYTYVDSRFEIRPGEFSQLPSTSQNTWNASIFYEKGPLTARLAAYSASADLFAVGSDKTSDVYNATRTSMDFGASYAFAPHWVTYFNAKNLLNTPHAFYEGTTDRPIQREFYDQTYQFGFRFDY
jgi:TonB-dependent receptor